jgi:L-rhamnose mutarotase
MSTLRIEHGIHDYAQWRTAFDGFAAARSNAGVRGYTIHLPEDDSNYLYLDLEFDGRDQARAFATFLREKVWSNPAASPGLAGQPQTRILDRQP